ncbi:MAG: hypothetical protein ACKV2T_38360 [Kofleriaceae bacterium]
MVGCALPDDGADPVDGTTNDDPAPECIDLDGCLEQETEPAEGDERVVDDTMIEEDTTADPRTGDGKTAAAVQWLMDADVRKRPPQGIWKIGARYLVTQDSDGNNDDDEFRLYLRAADGDHIRGWEKPYGSHGQTVFVERRADNDFNFYTSSKSTLGVVRFRLGADLKTLSGSGHVITPKGPEGGTAKGVVAFDRDADIAAVCGYTSPSTPGNEARRIRFYAMGDYLDGVLTKVARPVVFEAGHLGSLQGCGVHDGKAYMLLGNDDPGRRKWIYRVNIATGAVKRREITVDKQGADKYEPETLYAQNGEIIFGIYKGKNTDSRFYRMDPF